MHHGAACSHRVGGAPCGRCQHHPIGLHLCPMPSATYQKERGAVGPVSLKALSVLGKVLSRSLCLRQSSNKEVHSRLVIVW